MKRERGRPASPASCILTHQTEAFALADEARICLRCGKYAQADRCLCQIREELHAANVGMTALHAA